VVSLLLFVNIDKTNMENDCEFANLEDKYTFKFKERKKIAPLDIIYKHMLSSVLSIFTNRSKGSH
jgi:hypothetical protein